MHHVAETFDFIALTPGYPVDTAVAAFASRAGAIGILDLSFADLAEASRCTGVLLRTGGRRCGVKLPGDRFTLFDVVGDCSRLTHVILPVRGTADLLRQITDLQRDTGHLLQILVEVTSQAEAETAVAAGADGLIVKGEEAAGDIGDETTFVLLQRLLATQPLPLWPHGGIGEHTIGACMAAGAAGVVLDWQLALSREARPSEAVRAAISRMDGSETVVVGKELGLPVRLYNRRDLPAHEELKRLAVDLAREGEQIPSTAARWQAAVRDRIGAADEAERAWPIGPDAAFAKKLAERFVTVGGIIAGLRRAGERDLGAASELRPLAEGAPLARTHATRFPIVQGPMTRVSDQPAFARSVAEAGALPFLAFALMDADEIAKLLRQTRAALGGRPFGAGILGFAPRDLRRQQLAALKSEPPPFALIAGGLPEQAQELEACGIATYLHVPSPGLLRIFLEAGVRRFVFEGRECGGHVGPRSSFVLWGQMIDTLLDVLPPDQLSECRVLFAGGIHDAISASMVATAAAALAVRGVQIGVLMGTAYLFTDEAVAGGAIVETFRQEAIRCQRTVLLESGPGHATRCAASRFTGEFFQLRSQLLADGGMPNEIREKLERLNIGRLRIASKGLMRLADGSTPPVATRLTKVARARQRAEGLYMLGQVAALRHDRCNLEELHQDVACESTRRLDALTHRMAAQRRREARASDIAIIGMSCMLPGARDIRTYWNNILSRVDAITEVPAQRWDWQVYYDPDKSAPDRIYSKWGGFLADHPFDPGRYGMPPAALPSIDPLQLLTLEAVRAALADAGYLERPFDRDKASVVLGLGGGSGELGQRYGLRAAIPQFFDPVPANVMDRLPDWTEDSFAGILLNVAAGRVANRFDFHGVNFTVDAACASSLAASYLAVNELQAGNSDLMVVGGVDTVQNPFGFLCFSKTQALSPSGKCRPFDAAADGIAISEGLAFVVLKRLADAERDGDRVYAVIKGIAGSSDGRGKGLTAPRTEGQAFALDRAYAKAGFGAETVHLMEAHGTGTVAGDRTEVETLTRFFESNGAAASSCALGSVKSMIGHTKCAAGLAGMLKVALALYHRVLPATINVERPNPSLFTTNNPIYVNTETRPWLTCSDHPRRAGVNSFGFGGTNFTAVLEEYDADPAAQQRAATPDWPGELLIWRADDFACIAGDLAELSDLLAAGAKPALRDLAALLWRTAQERSGRTLAIVATSLDDLALKLKAAHGCIVKAASAPPLGDIYFSRDEPSALGKIAFLFPGQGSQSVNMLTDLALNFSEVRGGFEQAQSVLAGQLPELGRSVFPPPAFTTAERQAQTAALTRTDVAQPALGAASMGVLRLLTGLGVRPDMAAGHSYGEIAALCSAGMFDEETLYRLSADRGRAVLEGITGEPGTMAAVKADRYVVERLLCGIQGVWLANINAPQQIAIAGSSAGIALACERMRAQGIVARELSVACAFHTPIIGDAGARLAATATKYRFSQGHTPVYSNVNAAVLPPDPAGLPVYLGEQLTSPVHFHDQIEAMYRDGARVFVEVGPKNVLSGLVGNILGNRTHVALPLDVPGRHGVVQLLHVLARLVATGVRLDLSRLFNGRDVTPLTLASLLQETREQPLPPTAWLVNGGHARPLPVPSQAVWRKLSDDQAETSTVDSVEGTLTMPMDPTGERRQANQRSAAAGNTQASNAQSSYANRGNCLPDDAPHVMEQFQRVMERFLETQQNVMRLFLTGGVGSALPVVAELPEVISIPEVVVPPAPAASDLAASSSAAAPPKGGRDTEVHQEHRAPPRLNGQAARPLVELPTYPVHAGPTDAHPDVQPHAIAGTLLRIVADRTGYPEDLLGLDMDLEADLGVDSIKRVEILAGFRRALHGAQGAIGLLPENATEIRTLRGMIELFETEKEATGRPFGAQRIEVTRS